VRHLERRVETLILYFLRECGLEPWKNETVGIYDVKRKRFKALTGPFSAKGCPDLLCCLPGGRLFAIEVKSLRGRQTPHQKAFQDRINRFKGIAIVAKSVKEVYDQLKPFWNDIENYSHLLRKYEVHEPKQD